MSQAEGNSSQDATTNDQCVNTTSAASTPSTELHVTYMINKPRFVLSATRDGTTRTTLTELMRAAKKPVLSGHVGRLDYETGGLILATTDGRLNSGLRSPVRCKETINVDTPFPYCAHEFFVPGNPL